MKNNTYFEGMKKAICEWNKAYNERKARKEEIIKTCGWDSDEMKAWVEENEAAKYPYESGASKAYHAWMESVRFGEDELEMNDFLWEREVHDFVETLRAAGLKSFVYTNSSSAVMENIHALVAEGCKLDSLCVATRKDNCYGSGTETVMPGIRFSLD